MEQPYGPSMAKNFDDMDGTWDTVSRRLNDFLHGDEWEESPAVSTYSRLWDGRANFDEIHFPTLGYSGCTLRLFDPEKEEWSLYWASSRNGLLAMPPNVGKFDPDGIGRFYCEEKWEGEDIICRYEWSDMSETTARWEQAFSLDGGKTWKPNWVMTSTKRV